MYLLFVLSFSSLIISAVPSLRVGGRKHARPDEYPYVVRIEKIRKISWKRHVLRGFTTGSLITPIWVLTCAHCIIKYKVKEVRIRYGNMSEPWQNTSNFKNAIKFMIYPTYRSTLMGKFIENDIALVKVDKTPIATVRLSGIEYTTFSRLHLKYVGYGVYKRDKTKKNNFTQPLQVGEGGLIPCEEGNVGYSPTLCVAPKCKNIDVALHYVGSGGPLLRDGHLIGVAGGPGPYHKTATKVLMHEFTPISPFLDWIEDHIINWQFH